MLAWALQNDHDHTMHLCPLYWRRQPSGGYDSQAGTLFHEMSHFDDTAFTKDFGCLPVSQGNNVPLCKDYARTDPEMAITSADNYTYFVEEHPSAGCSSSSVAGRSLAGNSWSWLACVAAALLIARHRGRREHAGRRLRMLKLIGGICLFAVPACFLASAQPGPAVQAPRDPDPRFQCALSAPGNVSTEGPAPVTMTLKNTGTKPLKFLDWGTPFWGIVANHPFNISRDGTPVPFDGLMVNIKEASADSYIELAPGQSKSATVDLRATYEGVPKPGYDLSVPGVYSIRFARDLADVVEGAPAPASRRMTRLDCAPVVVTVSAAGEKLETKKLRN